ncbi:hypothetical protein ABZV58_30905 [Nocardia sp. NPDC004654]|uniref:hypothetical protein n=1 Tax=Nocardia sp. NPDC004654 TaxID=3154776 RepID=UPI0033A4FDC9
MHSADTILPQYQNLSVGESLPLSPRGPRMRVAVCDRPRALVFASADGNWVWAFGLYPDPAGMRLVSRNRITIAARIAREAVRVAHQAGPRRRRRQRKQRAPSGIAFEQAARRKVELVALHAWSDLLHVVDCPMVVVRQR